MPRVCSFTDPLQKRKRAKVHKKCRALVNRSRSCQHYVLKNDDYCLSHSKEAKAKARELRKATKLLGKCIALFLSKEPIHRLPFSDNIAREYNLEMREIEKGLSVIEKVEHGFPHNRYAPRAGNRSGYAGVYYQPACKNPWVARLRTTKANLHLGCFSTPEEADLARKVYINALHKQTHQSGDYDGLHYLKK